MTAYTLALMIVLQCSGCDTNRTELHNFQNIPDVFTCKSLAESTVRRIDSYPRKGYRVIEVSYNCIETNKF